MLTAFVPIWALTVLGYRAELVLGRLVCHVAMPAVLFTTLSRTPVSRLLSPAIAVLTLVELDVRATAGGNRWRELLTLPVRYPIIAAPSAGACPICCPRSRCPA